MKGNVGMNLNYLGELFLQIGRYVPQTVGMALAAMVIAIALGALLTIMYSFKATNWFVRLYLLIFRGFPTLVILFVAYFGIPELLNTGSSVSPLAAAIFCFALKEAAYLEEIFRSGLSSVDGGQVEAGRSLGLSNQKVYRFIVIPQAIRIMIPNIGNTFIGLLKETSLAFSIGVTELFGEGKLIASENFQYFEVYVVVGIWYVILILIYTIFQQFLERRYSQY